MAFMIGTGKHSEQGVVHCLGSVYTKNRLKNTYPRGTPIRFKVKGKVVKSRNPVSAPGDGGGGGGDDPFFPTSDILSDTDAFNNT